MYEYYDDGEQTVINSWTCMLNRAVIKISKKSKSYMWMHRENSIYLNDVYEWIAIISFSMSFFNAIILMFDTNIIYVKILSILLSFMSGLLVFYIKDKNPSGLAERHKLASSRYSSIINNIERQGALPKKFREIGTHYHRWITLQFDTLKGTAPDIDSNIIDKYGKIFGKRWKIHPIEAEEYASDELREVVVDERSKREVNLCRSSPLENIKNPLVKTVKTESDEQKEDQSLSSGVSVSDDSSSDEGSDEGSDGGSYSEEYSESSEAEMNKMISVRSVDRSMDDMGETIVSRRSNPRNNRRNSMNVKSKSQSKDKTRRDKQKLLTYELNRMNMNMMYNMDMGNAANKCYIDHFD